MLSDVMRRKQTIDTLWEKAFRHYCNLPKTSSCCNLTNVELWWWWCLIGIEQWICETSGLYHFLFYGKKIQRLVYRKHFYYEMRRKLSYSNDNLCKITEKQLQIKLVCNFSSNFLHLCKKESVKFYRIAESMMTKS